MKLDQYLSRSETTSLSFSRRLRATLHAVNKWRQGKRIPRYKTMAKIHKITKGKVSYKDWN